MNYIMQAKWLFALLMHGSSSEDVRYALRKWKPLVNRSFETENFLRGKFTFDLMGRSFSLLSSWTLIRLSFFLMKIWFWNCFFLRCFFCIESIWVGVSALQHGLVLNHPLEVHVVDTKTQEFILYLFIPNYVNTTFDNVYLACIFPCEACSIMQLDPWGICNPARCTTKMQVHFKGIPMVLTSLFLVLLP